MWVETVAAGAWVEMGREDLVENAEDLAESEDLAEQEEDLAEDLEACRKPQCAYMRKPSCP